MSFGEENVIGKCAINIAISFGFGLIFVLWAYGLYGIVKTFKIYFYPQYVAFAFALFYIMFTILLEHRGVEMPYLLISGAILSAFATFFVTCVINGILWLQHNGLPDFNTALFELSISSVVAFVLAKLIAHGLNNKV